MGLPFLAEASELPEPVLFMDGLTDLLAGALGLDLAVEAAAR